MNSDTVTITIHRPAWYYLICVMFAIWWDLSELGKCMVRTSGYGESIFLRVGEAENEAMVFQFSVLLQYIYITQTQTASGDRDVATAPG